MKTKARILAALSALTLFQCCTQLFTVSAAVPSVTAEVFQENVSADEQEAAAVIKEAIMNRTENFSVVTPKNGFTKEEIGGHLIYLACFAVCIALNFYTIRTYGSNVVETVIKAARSGFSIDLKELMDIDTDNYPVTTTAAITGSTVMTTATTTATGSYWYTSATTAFVGTYTEYTTTMITSATTASGGASVTPPSSTSSGVIDLCDENARGFAEQLITAAAKYGIEPCVPVYMPAFLRDIRITDVNYEELSDSKDFYASFAADGAAVDVIIEHYASEDVMPEVLIPSDALSSRTFNSGRLKGIIIEDGDSCTVLFMDGNTAYTVHTSGISADDVYDISTSLLPYSSAEDK